MAELATSQPSWVRWLGNSHFSHLSTMAGAQPVQPSSGAWLVIIRWQPSATPATRTNGCALVAPGLAGRLPSAAIELSPAMALEEGCNLYDARYPTRPKDIHLENLENTSHHALGRHGKTGAHWLAQVHHGTGTPKEFLCGTRAAKQSSTQPYLPAACPFSFFSQPRHRSVILYPPPLVRGDPPAGRWSAPEVDRTPPPVARSLGGGRCDDRPPPSVGVLAV